MPPKIGIDAQLGAANETTYGTFVTPSRFFEFNSENIKLAVDRITSSGLRAGRVNKARSGAYESHRKGAAGTVEMEVQNKGFGFWLQYMMGSVASSQPDVGGAPTVWEHEGSIANLAGKKLALQVGKPSVDGTVYPFSYEGGKINSWEFSVGVGDILTVSFDMDFEDEDLTPLLAVAAYPANLRPLSFLGGQAQIPSGAQVDVTNINFSSSQNLKTDRYYIRPSPLKKEPLDTQREITGSVELDFEGITQYERFVDAAEVAIKLIFEGGTISGAFKYGLTIECPAVRFDGESPSVGGPDVVMQPAPFTVLDDSATLTYTTTDVAP